MIALLLLLALIPQHGAGRKIPTKTVDDLVNNGRSVLVIILDDVAIDDYQSAQTPHLDALAASGVFFVNAHANAVCSPTRISLQTGFYRNGGAVTDCGPFDPNTNPPAGTRLLPSIAPSYSSILTGKWHVGGSPSGANWTQAALERGFGSWRAGMANNVEGCDGFNYNAWRRCDDGVSKFETLYEPTETADALVAWWNRTPGPRLAVWAPNLAHGPFHRPPEELLPEGYPATPNNRLRFSAMISAFDTLAAEVISNVDISKDLVILIGDNGTPPQVAPAGQSGKVKGTTFRRGTNVPLLVLGSGMAPGVRTELVHVVDVFPTVAEWVNMLPGPTDGVSLLTPGGHPCIVTSGLEDVAVRTLDFLLRETPAGRELYDLAVDPGETVDLILDPAYDGIVGQLSVTLDEFLSRP